MQEIGKIIAILNENLVVISCEVELIDKDVITVYAIICDERFKDVIGIDHIVFPKGKIRVVCKQSSGLFIAERFRESREIRRTITEPSALQQALTSSFMGWVGRQKDVIETVHGDWSANFDQSSSLKIEIGKIINIGDIVGR